MCAQGPQNGPVDGTWRNTGNKDILLRMYNFRTTNRVDFWRHDKTCEKPESSGHTSADRAVVTFELHTLARRLVIGDTSALDTEQGWQIRVLLKWQRLV